MFPVNVRSQSGKSWPAGGRPGPGRLLPEQELADLAAGIPRQFGHEPPVARDLVVRQPLAGP